MRVCEGARARIREGVSAGPGVRVVDGRARAASQAESSSPSGILASDEPVGRVMSGAIIRSDISPSLATGHRARALPPSLADAARTRGGRSEACTARRWRRELRRRSPRRQRRATRARSRDARRWRRLGHDDRRARACRRLGASRGDAACDPRLRRVRVEARRRDPVATTRFPRRARRRFGLRRRRRARRARRRRRREQDGARQAQGGGAPRRARATRRLCRGQETRARGSPLALVQAAEPRPADAPAPDAAPDASPAPESKPRRDFQRTLFNSRPAERVSGGDEIGEDADSNFSGMELTFLGTSSGSPSFTRNVSSYALRLTDEIWLFDCGEARLTTRASACATRSRASFIMAHMHGDHIFGLPGLICALSGSAHRGATRCTARTRARCSKGWPCCIRRSSRASADGTVLNAALVVTELAAPGNGVAGIGGGDGGGRAGSIDRCRSPPDGGCRGARAGGAVVRNFAPASAGFGRRRVERRARRRY